MRDAKYEIQNKQINASDPQCCARERIKGQFLLREKGQFRFTVAVKAELGASEERAREQLAKKEAELKRLELGAEVRKTKHHETMRLLGDKKKVRTDNRVRIFGYFCATVCRFL
jgi:hypothetical protein